MTDCNACTPQHLNPPGTNCHNVPTRFIVRGRGTPFVNIGPAERNFHVSYLKYGANPHGYQVHYQPVEWSCTCPDFTRRLQRQVNCKHIMMCVDLMRGGYSGTVYPSPNFLTDHVQLLLPTFHQMVPT